MAKAVSVSRSGVTARRPLSQGTTRTAIGSIASTVHQESAGLFMAFAAGREAATISPPMSSAPSGATL